MLVVLNHFWPNIIGPFVMFQRRGPTIPPWCNHMRYGSYTKLYVKFWIENLLYNTSQNMILAQSTLTTKLTRRQPRDNIPHSTGNVQVITLYDSEWNVIACACINFNGGLVKSPLKSGHACAITPYSYVCSYSCYSRFNSDLANI